MVKIYLDDVRTPIDEDWIVVRNYEEFVSTVTRFGLQNIDVISLDHDLGETAMNEYYNNVRHNYKIDYDNIVEKTGLDCAKWLINHYYDNHYSNIKYTDRRNKKSSPIIFPKIYTHSANPIGSANIMGYVNNFFMNEGQPQDCIRVRIEHYVK